MGDDRKRTDRKTNNSLGAVDERRFLTLSPPPLPTHEQPNKITVAKGETVEFVNNKAFPHNVVFDEDNVPSGVNADAISHEDYLNGPGEKVTNKFDTPGTYGYYCEPHQGAGMTGTIVVN